LFQLEVKHHQMKLLIEEAIVGLTSELFPQSSVADCPLKLKRTTNPKDSAGLLLCLLLVKDPRLALTYCI
jgi:hypothetical protein